jgi:hypothetical protein
MLVGGRKMQCFWTLHAPGLPTADFGVFPDYWTYFSVTMIIIIAVAVDRQERKLDRIMKHLGLAAESPKPALTAESPKPAPTARMRALGRRVAEARRAALQVWAHPRLRPLRKLVRTGVATATRFIDGFLNRPPAGKGRVQDEV